MKTLGSFAFVLGSGLLLPSARVSQEKPATPAPAYVVVELEADHWTSGLALLDKEFKRLVTHSVGGRLEFAVSPSREKMAVAWMNSEDQRFLQVFHAKDLTPASAKTPISFYATTTVGFGNPMLWIGESTIEVQFVTTPRSTPDEGFDRFYAQVFQLPPQPNQPLALHPDYAELIPLPPDNTHVLAISEGNAIVLNKALELRTVNLKTGAMGQAIQVRPDGQDGLRESPMSWCLKDDSTLLLFGFDGSVKEIQLKPELKIVRQMMLPDWPAKAHVAQYAIERDPFRPDRVLIGTYYLDKPGPVEVRALNGSTLIESKDRGSGEEFAAGRDGAILFWKYGPPASIRIEGPSGTSNFKFDGMMEAIVSLK